MKFREAKTHETKGPFITSFQQHGDWRGRHQNMRLNDALAVAIGSRSGVHHKGTSKLGTVTSLASIGHWGYTRNTALIFTEQVVPEFNR